MTVQTTSSKAGPFTGNGVVTVFQTGFRIDQAADLQVVHTDANGIDAVLDPGNYGVAGFGDPAGISVSYPLSGAPMPASEKLTLLRLVTYDQQTSLTNQGGFYPAVIEKALDRIVYQCQQLAEKLGRAVLVNASSTLDPSAQLASILSNAVAAATSAQQAATTYATFHNQYLGPFASDPIADNSGGALIQGALYWNTATAKLRIYSGAGWQDTAVASPTNFSRNIFSGDGSTVNFTLAATPPNVNSILVAIGGVLQRPTTDYTFAGTTLSFTSAPPSGSNNILALVASSLAIGVPSDNSVTTAKFASGADASALANTGRLINTIVYSPAGAYTYTKNPNATRIEVEGVGAGGGGGGCGNTGAGNVSAAGGGGGGGYFKKSILNSALSATTTVTIGIGGAGGSIGNTGSGGGTTSFGAFCSATGGAGGQGHPGTTGTGYGTQGQSGGVGSGGDINGAGSVSMGAFVSGANATAYSGNGGGSHFGSGGQGQAVGSAGSAATGLGGQGPGGGGSGGVCAATSGRAGGAGTDGLVIIREFA